MDGPVRGLQLCAREPYEDDICSATKITQGAGSSPTADSRSNLDNGYWTRTSATEVASGCQQSDSKTGKVLVKSATNIVKLLILALIRTLAQSKEKCFFTTFFKDNSCACSYVKFQA